MLSSPARHTLLNIVRGALQAAVAGKRYVPPAVSAPELLACCGCFVTYKTRGELRGCLGCFTSQEPLYRTVAAYAGYSATEDPRFCDNRLTEADLPAVYLDISVLSPLRPCADPTGIVLGRDGIYVKKGGRSGCFLPQVATETGWDVADYWGYCCSHKAGLPHDAWQQPDIQLFTFTAEVIEAVFADIP